MEQVFITNAYYFLPGKDNSEDFEIENKNINTNK
tara:strand:+ start:265 stop:366 length:102 start_codon:yes stop_codon:yes gene_type:complete